MRSEDVVAAAEEILGYLPADPNGIDPLDEHPLDEEPEVDVTYELFFPNGYTLSSLNSILDELSFRFQAAFVAVESLERGVDPSDIAAELQNGELRIIWTVESLEVGSAIIRGRIDRVGGWWSRRGRSTKWALGAVAAAPVPGAGWITWALGAAVFAGLEYAEHSYDRSLREHDNESADAEALPEATAAVDMVPAAQAA